jgi:hypothetical protein
MEVVFVMDQTKIELDNLEAEELVRQLGDADEADSAATKIRHALREGGEVTWTRPEKEAVASAASGSRREAGTGLAQLWVELKRDLDEEPPAV